MRMALLLSCVYFRFCVLGLHVFPLSAKSGQGQKSLGANSIPFVQFAGVWVCNLFWQRCCWNCKFSWDPLTFRMTSLQTWSCKKLSSNETLVGSLYLRTNGTKLKFAHKVPPCSTHLLENQRGKAFMDLLEPTQVGRHVPVQECGISFACSSCGG